jgi:tryptophan synthase alpha chain
MTVPKALELVRQIRARAPELPLINMTYYNPIWHYGLERYAHDAKAVGVDAHIVTDLTPEEAEEWIAISRKEALDTVFLLAPTSTPDRIAVVSQISTGFIYCVSRTGVTGARQDIPTDLQSVVSAIKGQTDQPVCVGFGVSQPEHVRRIAAFTEGVVVGSSLVDLIYHHKDDPDLLDRVRNYVAGLKAATRS